MIREKAMSLWDWLKVQPRQLQAFLAITAVVWMLGNVAFTWDYIARPAPAALESVAGGGILVLIVWLAGIWFTRRNRS